MNPHDAGAGGRDVARFCRMMLNGGTLDGRSGEFRTAAVYSQVGGFNKDMWIDRKQGRAYVFLAQKAGPSCDDRRHEREAVAGPDR